MFAILWKVVSHRHFGNKLWQATRFTLARHDALLDAPTQALPLKTPRTVEEIVAAAAEAAPSSSSSSSMTPLATRWLLSRFGAAAAESERGLTEFNLAATTSALRTFVVEVRDSLYRK